MYEVPGHIFCMAVLHLWQVTVCRQYIRISAHELRQYQVADAMIEAKDCTGAPRKVGYNQAEIFYSIY